MTNPKIKDALMGIDKDISPNGYIKLGELIIQWGTFTATALETYPYDTRVTFPTPFPNNIYSITHAANIPHSQPRYLTASWTNPGPHIGVTWIIRVLTNESGQSPVGNCEISWMAIGN